MKRHSPREREIVVIHAALLDLADVLAISSRVGVSRERRTLRDLYDWLSVDIRRISCRKRSAALKRLRTLVADHLT